MERGGHSSEQWFFPLTPSAYAEPWGTHSTSISATQLDITVVLGLKRSWTAIPFK